MNKGLYKKITDTKTSQGRKHEKLNPSRRSLLKKVGAIEIEKEHSEPVYPRLSDYGDESPYEPYNKDEAILDSLGFSDPLKPVYWHTEDHINGE